MNAFTINLKPIIQITDDQFYQLCCANPDVKFERNAQGEIIIMPPTGGETGKRNAGLIIALGIWNNTKKLGVVFDSSTCFKFPNKADRSPDVSWIKNERWDALTPEEKRKFPPIAPDFVLELMSPSDTGSEIQAKMAEYQENQVKLGWLIDPKTRRVEIYRVGQEVEVLQAPATLSGEDVLPGFVLNLQTIWE